jgi:hypothetical protein
MKSTHISSLPWLTLLVLISPSIQYLEFADLYKGLQYITDSTAEPLLFNKEDNFFLRKTEISEEEYGLVFEYNLNKEGLVAIVKEEPENPEESRYTIYVDYLLKNVPFILGSITIDTTNPEHNDLDKTFKEKYFLNGKLMTKRQILRRLNQLPWNSSNLEVLTSMINTHRFIKFSAPTPNITLKDFSLRLDNAMIRANFQSEINQNKFPLISGEQFKSIIPSLFEKIIEFGYNQVYNEIEGDYNLYQKDRAEKKKELTEKRDEIVEELGGVVQEFQELIEANKETVFDLPNLQEKVRRIRNVFNDIADADVVYSGGLFYKAKYFYETFQSTQDPVEILSDFGKEVDSAEKLKANFIETLRKLSHGYVEFLSEAYESGDFKEKSEGIITKVMDSIEPYYAKMGLDTEKHVEMVEDAKAQLQRVFLDRNINEMLFYRGLNPIFSQLEHFIETSDVEIFQTKDGVGLKNSYFQVGAMANMTNEEVEYQVYPGDLFESDFRVVI